MSKFTNIKKLVAAAAITAGALTTVTGSAHAASFQFDTDSTNIVRTQATLTFSEMRWSQEVGGSTITGQVVGNVSWNGVIAGCARVRVEFKNNAGTVIRTRTSAEVCSNSSLPAFGSLSGMSHSSSSLRKATVKLQVKPFGASSYSTIGSTSVEAGGN